MAAVQAAAQEIDSEHLLTGLLAEPSPRVDQLFKLAERFPEDASRARSLVASSGGGSARLNNSVKRIFNYACQEANRTGDYWIDTDHLLLGILREGKCAAAIRLRSHNIEIGGARNLALSAKREQYGPAPMLWKLATPISRAGRIAGMLYLVTIALLITILTGRHC